MTQEGSSIRPIWMPDGERITFASDRDGTRSLYSQPADGSGVAQRLTTAAEGAVHSPESWRPDGETLSFLEAVAGNPNADVAGGNLSVWTVSPTQGGDPELLPDTPDTNRGGSMFSPDGNWIAYHSNFGGGAQIYVQPFPSTGVRHQVTQDGGLWPTWSADGEELFFERNGSLVAVAVSIDPTFSFGAERMLPIQGFFAGAQNYRNWDIMPDGERFLMVMPSDSAEIAEPQINIVLNWTQELLERVPVD